MRDRAYFHIAHPPASFLPDFNQTKEIKIPQFSHNFFLTLGPEQESSTIPLLYIFLCLIIRHEACGKGLSRQRVPLILTAL